MCNVVVIVKAQVRTCFAIFNNNVCLSSGNSGWQYSTNTFIYSLKNYYGYGYYKKDVNITISMPHTAAMAMVQPLEEVMISTLQIMPDTIPTLTLIAFRIIVSILMMIPGPEVHPSVQVNWKFTMKCVLKSGRP